MLSPRKQKYRKQMRNAMKGDATRGTTLAFGDFGILTEEQGWITSRQIEAARRAITNFTKQGGTVWIRIYPEKAISKKPPEVRMGGGKGDTAEYVAPVRPGRMLFEMSGVTPEIAKEALRLAAHKLPVKTKFVFKVGR